MGAPSISGSRPLAFCIATARDDVREQLALSRAADNTVTFGLARPCCPSSPVATNELIARKRNPTHTFETPDGYRRFRPLLRRPSNSLHVSDTIPKAAQGHVVLLASIKIYQIRQLRHVGCVAPFKANARNRAISHSAR